MSGVLATTIDEFSTASLEMDVGCWNRSHVESGRLFMLNTVMVPRRMDTGEKCGADRAVLPCVEREAGGELSSSLLGCP